MSLARRLAANAATALRLQLGLAVLGLIATSVLVRALGTERYGAWALIGVIVAYGGLLELGLGVALVPRVAALLDRGDRTGLARALGAAVAATSALGLMGAGVLWVASEAIGIVVRVPAPQIAEFVTALHFGAISVCLGLPGVALGVVPTALQRLDLLLRLEAAVALGTVALQVAVALAGGGLVELAAAGALGRAASLAGRALQARHLLGGLELRLDPRYPFWSELGRFGAIKVVQQLASLLVLHLDRLLIALILSASAVAYYAVPLELAQKLLFVQTNVSLAFYPAACAAAASRDRTTLSSLYERTSRLVAVGTLPLAAVLVVLAEPVLGAWVGEPFSTRSADLLRVLAIAYAAVALTAIPSATADALNRPEIAAYYSVAGLGLNVALALLLIPRLGIMGSGLAILGNALLQAPWFVRAVTRDVVGVPLRGYAARAIGKPLVPAVVCGFVLAAAAAGGLTRGIGLALALAAGFAAFVAALRAFGVFDAAEGRLLGQLPGGRAIQWLAGR
jgi:O-antigen/teichoic acid export membrane protein